MSEKKTRKKQRISFTVDGHLLRELGERLVSRRSIAVAELVRNSYDADSTEVKLSFKGIRGKGGTIVIEDDGHGMSIDDIDKTWMMIATSEKRRNPISPRYKRMRSGEKGIGRFACQVLSHELLLESVCETARGKERITATFTWGDLWTRGKLTEATVDFVVERVPDNSKTGTKLTLKRTRQAWKEEDLGEMRRDVLSLINPFSWETIMSPDDDSIDPGFSIAFDVPDFPKFEGKLSDYYLKAAWGKLEGSISEKGKTTYKLKIRKGPKRQFTVPEVIHSDVGPVRFIVYFFELKSEAYHEFEFGLGDVRQSGKELGGIRIYQDHLRVFPYGETGVDWLKLESDRSRRIADPPRILSKSAKGTYRPLLQLPLYTNLIGAVFLTRRSNSNIVVSITRNGLVENEAYKQLSDFVRLGIDWLTVIYSGETADVRPRITKKRKKKSKTTIAEMKTVIESAISTSNPEEKGEALETLQDLSQGLEEELAEEERETIAVRDMYQVLASTGTLVGVLSHELIALKEALGYNRSLLDDIRNRVPIEPRRELAKVSKTLEKWDRFLSELSDSITRMIARDSRDQIISLAIHEAIEDVSAAFGQYCDMFGITVINDVPTNLQTPPMYLAKLYSIISNLLTNAVKWVRFSDNRRIAFKGRLSEGGVEILVLDTGPGVPVEIREDVFRPFVSYSTPDLRKGTGTGLGLAIVRDFVLDVNGSVEFIDPPDKWGTCVRIWFPGR